MCKTLIEKQPYAIKQHKKLCRLKCMYCPRTIPGIFRYSDHMAMNPLILSICTARYCMECFFICRNRSEMMQHHLQKHDLKYFYENKQHICGYKGCQKSYRELKRLNEHRKIHYRTYKCTVNGCIKTFGKRSDLKDHMRIRHLRDIQSEKCQYCCKQFASERLLTKHVKIAHSGIGRSYLCRICHKRFDRKSVLQQHLDSHKAGEQRGIFQCNSCKEAGIRKTFTLKYNLNKHIRKYHKKDRKVMRTI